MRYLIAAALVLCCGLCCGLCLAEDFPENTNKIKSLTAEQAAKLVAKKKGGLSLYGLTSIDKDVLKILKSNKSITLPEKYSDKKD